MNFWRAQGLSNRLFMLLSTVSAVVFAGLFIVNDYLDRRQAIKYFALREDVLSDIHNQSLILAFLGFSGFALLAISTLLVTRNVTKPLREMAGVANRIAHGNLDAELPDVSSGGEVGQLAEALQVMQHGIKLQIQRVAEESAARSLLESQLSIARGIQESFIPQHFPTLPGLRLEGCCIPASEVGGDFFDLVAIGDRSLFFIIGDVAGKGMPAALYMAATVTLARALAKEGLEPSRLLERLNEELCGNNETCMFVTIFCGLIDSANGRVEYSNAGHNPPLLLDGGGSARFIDIEPGIAVGCFGGYRYSSGSIQLSDGDSLILYTDGVNEAVNPDGDFFGNSRLCETISGVNTVSVLENLRFGVEMFAGSAPQADDITILVLGKGVTV